LGSGEGRFIPVFVRFISKPIDHMEDHETLAAVPRRPLAGSGVRVRVTGALNIKHG